MNVFPYELKEASTKQDQWCRLDFLKDPMKRRMSSIICTIGPSSRSVDTIYQMIKTGMTIARINFSHESHDEHLCTVAYLRQAVEKYSKELGYDYHVAIAGDLKGREIRTGLLWHNRLVELKCGENVKLTVNQDLSNKCTKDIIYVDYPTIINDVAIGQRIYLDDWRIALEIREIGVDSLICGVQVGGNLSNRVSVVVVGAMLTLPVLSEKDGYDIKFCMDNDFDFLFLSKMRTAEDIQIVRKYIGRTWNKRFKLITKIENIEALYNIEELMTESDGIIFARSDLSIEMANSRIFLAQKCIVARCNRLGKPIVVGTQLLLSTVSNPLGKYGEIADAGNALVDGADGLMLSSETSMGSYPIDAVKCLAHAGREAEAAIWHRKLAEDLIAINHSTKATSGAHAVAVSVVMTSLKVVATAIVVVTVSGRSAQLISSYRPRCPILGVTRCGRVARQLNFYRGIIPIRVSSKDSFQSHLEDMQARVQCVLEIAQKIGIVKSGDAIVVLTPWKKNSVFKNNVHVIYAYFENEPVGCMTQKQSNIGQKMPAVSKRLGL